MAEKKKILILNDLLVGGGVEKLIYDFVWHWHDKYEITVLTNMLCKKHNEILPQNVKYMSIWGEKKQTYNQIEVLFDKVVRKIHEKKTLRSLRKMSFDVVLAMKEGCIQKDGLNIKANQRFGWVHTDYLNHYYTHLTFGDGNNEVAVMKQYDGIVCVAEDVRNSIIAKIGDPGNLMVFYNPIDVENIKKRAEEEVTDLPPKTDKVRFITVGRTHFQKGYDLLLEACHMLENDGLEFEVFVIGEDDPMGGDSERLHLAMNRLDIHSVQFLGVRENPYKYMKMADWFLSTSIFEGYSLVSQEAAVLELPLILTKCSGVRELIGDNEYGVGMDISVIGIYEKMKWVIEHPELQALYKQRIVERKRIINFDQRLEKIEQLFN